MALKRGTDCTSTLYGDWLEGEASTKGRPLGIGNRASGKYARIYEKGKQLGDTVSPWTRIEVEWRAQDRHIPYDLLLRPGHYLAGSYPCLAFLTEEQSTIKTIAKGAQIAYDTAVENAKRHCGKIVNLMLDVLGGDYAGVVDSLIRPGYPSRIDPYSYHVKQNRYMALVRTILRKACNEWEWLDRVPKVGMFRDKEGRIRSLSRDEFSRLIAELPEHLADMARFSVATGLRQANVTRLQWKQISLERRHLWVSATDHKNGRPHSVPLKQGAIDVLEKRQGDHPTHVFTYEGNPIVQVNTKAWRNALQRAGIQDFRWHDLRHTFATWHREAGTPTHELQRLGGWKTQSMVERYAHVAPEGLQLAASRLDSFIKPCGVSRENYLPDGKA